MKKAVSVTLDAENLLWLRGQAGGTRGNLSEVLDRLVREARLAGRTNPAAVRSIVGTIDIAADDPDLTGADTYIRNLFERSVRRPLLVRPSTSSGRSERVEGRDRPARPRKRRG